MRTECASQPSCLVSSPCPVNFVQPPLQVVEPVGIRGNDIKVFYISVCLWHIKCMSRCDYKNTFTGIKMLIIFSKLSLFSIVISTPKTSSYATFRVLSRTHEYISVPVSSKFSTTLGPVYNEFGYNEQPAIRKIFCVFFDPVYLLCRQAVLREVRPDNSEEIQILRIVRNSLQRAELCR